MSNWGKAEIETFKTKKMSDEREICMREYDKKVVLCEFEIRYASKVWEQKLIICLGNTLSLVITMAQDSEKFLTGLYLFAGSVNH